MTKFDTKEKVFGQYENNDDFRTLGASLQSKTKLSDNISVLFQGRYDHFNVVNKGAFSPKGVIFIDDNTGGSLRLSMSQSHNTDNAYTLFSDYAAALQFVSLRERGPHLSLDSHGDTRNFRLWNSGHKRIYADRNSKKLAQFRAAYKKTQNI